MRYIQYYPGLNGKVTGVSLGFDTEEESDAYCIEMNEAMINSYQERSLPPPLHRYQTVQIVKWMLLVTEFASVFLFIVFLHKWTHGHYESAICALAARIMLFGLPVVSINQSR